jgi:hypothetical protein
MSSKINVVKIDMVKFNDRYERYAGQRARRGDDGDSEGQPSTKRDSVDDTRNQEKEND